MFGLTRNDAGVVTALGLQNAIAFSCKGDGLLGQSNRSRGLESDTEEDGGAVCDSSLDTSAVVGLGCELRLGKLVVGIHIGVGVADEHVIVGRSGDLGSFKSRADLKTLGGGNAEHSVGKSSLQLGEDWLAKSSWDVSNDTGHGASDAVLAISEIGNGLLHLGSDFRVWAADNRLVNGFARHLLKQLEKLGVVRSGGILGGWWDVVDVADRRNPSNNLNAVGELKVVLTESACGHSADGLSGTGTAATRGGTNTVLLKVGEVGVTGARVLLHGVALVVCRAEVLVLDDHGNWGAERDTSLHARLDGDKISLIARRGDGALAGTTARDLMLVLQNLEQRHGLVHVLT